MEYRALGRTGVDVSALCLGTMTFGEQNTKAEGHAQMDYALAHGINFFDTAELYSIPPRAETQGRTEEIIGSWFESRGTRDKVILATKVVGRGAMTWFRASGAPTELSKAQIHEAVDKSLTRLRTDYIDLYQLHFPDRAVSGWGSNPTIFVPPASAPEHPIEDILDALDGLVRAGKVRFIGLSNESPWGTMTFLHHAVVKAQTRVQSIQNAYNLLNRTFEVGLAEVALREGVGLLAYSPLAQGFLTGKYRNGALPEGSRKALFNRGQRYETPGAAEAIEAYWQLARDLDLDMAQLALQFVTTRPFVTSTIIGATTMAQLETNIASAKLRWSDEITSRINAIHQLRQNPCP